MIELSVLIPTLTERRHQFGLLRARLEKAAEPYAVEILSIEDQRETSTGAKRNKLIDMAQGKFSVFIDDDDNVSDYYFEAIFSALKTKPDVDCIGLKGMLIWANNGKREIFKHSVGLPYSDGMVNGEYLRPPNHLNPILTDYYKRIRFPDKTFAEDYDFCIKMAESGLIKNEIFVDKIMYYYNFNPNK